MKILKMVIKLLGRYQNKRKVEEKKIHRTFFFSVTAITLGKKIRDNSLPEIKDSKPLQIYKTFKQTLMHTLRTLCSQF